MEPLGVHLTWPDSETRPTMHDPTVSFIESADCVLYEKLLDPNYLPLNMSPSCHLEISDEEQPHSDGLKCLTFHQCEHSIPCRRNCPLI